VTRQDVILRPGHGWVILDPDLFDSPPCPYVANMIPIQPAAPLRTDAFSSFGVSRGYKKVCQHKKGRNLQSDPEDSHRNQKQRIYNRVHEESYSGAILIPVLPFGRAGYCLRPGYLRGKLRLCARCPQQDRQTLRHQPLPADATRRSVPAGSIPVILCRSRSARASARFPPCDPPEEEPTAESRQAGGRSEAQERWIDVDLSSQTVSAYQGEKRDDLPGLERQVARQPSPAGTGSISGMKATTCAARTTSSKTPYTMYFHKDTACMGPTGTITSASR
jgi:hypothetical protein